MRRSLVAVAVLFSLACGLSQTAMPAAPTSTAPPLPKGRCGDGVCDGPEDAASCPDDCALTSEPAAVGVPPVHVFYAIHTHASGDHLPYASPAMQTVNPQTTDNMLATIQAIPAVAGVTLVNVRRAPLNPPAEETPAEEGTTEAPPSFLPESGEHRTPVAAGLVVVGLLLTVIGFVRTRSW